MKTTKNTMPKGLNKTVRGEMKPTKAKTKTSASGSKPDFMDVNKNGNRKESMKTALASKSKGKK
jgi:hypothetical protein